MTYETSVLILNDQSNVLARRDGNCVVLPRINVEQGRVGISLSRALHDQLRIEVFILIPPSVPEDSTPVLRLQNQLAALPDDYTWIEPFEIADRYPQISVVLATFSADDTRFGCYAWYSQVQEWLLQRVSAMGRTLQSLEQWNGRVGGVLLRVETDGPQFWFKVVSDFNLRELKIAQILSEEHLLHFPQVMATEPAWNAFLLEHVQGVELYEHNDLHTWITVAQLLADVQIPWVGKAERLVRAGASDLRAQSMIGRIPGFLDHIEDAMTRQSKTPPERLTRMELEDMGVALCELCADVDALPFAEGLANADFSPHNTLITARGPVFIDWAEACISLPLIAGEYLWNRMAVESPERAQWRSELRKAYLRRWAEQYGSAPVEQAAEMLPAFAIFAVAMFYHERECRGPSPYDAYLRSLTRRLLDALNSATRYASQA